MAEYKIGDKVVFIDEFMPSWVMTISKLEDHAAWMDEGKKYSHLNMIRPATETEINAGERSDEIMNFKIGDKIVLKKRNDDRIYTVFDVKNGLIDFDCTYNNGSVGSWVKGDMADEYIRHATPEEIAAGRKLESCQ